MDKKQLHAVELTAENVKQYAGYLPEDEEENVGRFFFRGLLAVTEKDEIKGGMIWELRNMLYYEKHKSIIRTFLASDEEVSAFLFSEYKRRILEEDVTVSEFLLPAPNNKFVIDEFEKAGFSPELMESDTICTELSELKTLPFMKAKSQNDNGSMWIRNTGSTVWRTCFSKESGNTEKKRDFRRCPYMFRSCLDAPASAAGRTALSARTSATIRRRPTGSGIPRWRSWAVIPCF
jgi:hypothetical protein